MNLFDSTGKRISVTVLGIILLLSAIAWIYTGSFLTVLVIYYGIAIGPYLGLTYLTGAPLVDFTIALVLSITLFVIGLKYRTRTSGQVLTVIGVCGYGYCGLMGIGSVA